MSTETLAACAAIDPAAIRTRHHAPVFASVGLKFVIAELDDLATLAAAVPDTAAFRKAQTRHADETEHFPIFLYVREESPAGAPLAIRARMFAPLDKVPEDPATGSASGALGALLASLDPRADATLSITIRQGVEMGRESIIHVTAEKKRRHGWRRHHRRPQRAGHGRRHHALRHSLSARAGAVARSGADQHRQHHRGNRRDGDLPEIAAPPKAGRPIGRTRCSTMTRRSSSGRTLPMIESRFAEVDPL